MSEEKKNYDFAKPSDLFDALDQYYTQKIPKTDHHHIMDCPDGTCGKQIGELVKNNKEEPNYKAEGIIEHANKCPECRTKIGNNAVKNWGMIPRNVVIDVMKQTRNNAGVDALDAWFQKVSQSKTKIPPQSAGFT